MDKVVEDLVILDEIWAEVQRVSREELSERQRLAFWLQHWVQLSGEEIADLMTVMFGQKTTRNAIFTLTFQARLKFKKALERAGFEMKDLERIWGI